jgi:flagellar P-ring protein precursor FlgI
VLVIAVALALSGVAEAARIGDVTSLQGRRINKLVGLGLVTGLKGTGDGGNFKPAMNALAAFLAEFSNPVLLLDELKNAKNVATVNLEVILPENGVREGDRLDVQVASLGACKSLQGGRLIITPLQAPTRDVRMNLALASGPIRLVDPEVPTVGVIPGGAVMEEDIVHNYMAFGDELPFVNPWIEPREEYVTLVISDAQASWAMAYTIAQMINEDASDPGQLNRIAMAMDPKNVVVKVRDLEKADPAAFISRIETLDLFAPRGEARVRVNRNTKTVAISGEVEIMPTVISYKDLTIDTGRLGGGTGGAGRQPAPGAPAVSGGPLAGSTPQSHWIALDPLHRGKTPLADLLRSLEQLQVPAEDQINIVIELHRMGKLLGKLQVED